MAQMSEGKIISLDTHRQRPSRVYLKILDKPAKTGSKPFLSYCSDNNYYWCKWIESPHEIEAVINEIAASVIGQRLGARVRPWKIIYVPESLKRQKLGENQDRFTLTGSPLFGSLLLENAREILEPEVIPHIDEDANYVHVPKLIAL